MTVRWKLFANLAEAAGRKEVPVEAGAGDTFGDALEELLATHPELEAEVLDADGEIHDHIRVLHDGEDPFDAGAGRDAVLSGDDELALFPPVSGGRR